MGEKEDFLSSIKAESDPKEALLKSQIKSFLRGEETLKGICEYNKKENNGLPISEKTMRNRIKELEEQDAEIKELYEEYKGRTNRGYDYVPVIIYMLEHDLSQRAAAEACVVSRNNLKAAVEKMRDDPKIGKLIKKHAETHELGRNCPEVEWSEEEKKLLAEFKRNNGIGIEDINKDKVGSGNNLSDNDVDK